MLNGGVTMPNVRTLTIGGVTYSLQDNVSGYITGITSSDVTTALGFTPYNATNPNGLFVHVTLKEIALCGR